MTKAHTTSQNRKTSARSTTECERLAKNRRKHLFFYTMNSPLTADIIKQEIERKRGPAALRKAKHDAEVDALVKEFLPEFRKQVSVEISSCVMSEDYVTDRYGIKVFIRGPHTSRAGEEARWKIAREVCNELVAAFPADLGSSSLFKEVDGELIVKMSTLRNKLI